MLGMHDGCPPLVRYTWYDTQLMWDFPLETPPLDITGVNGEIVYEAGTQTLYIQSTSNQRSSLLTWMLLPWQQKFSHIHVSLGLLL